MAAAGFLSPSLILRPKPPQCSFQLYFSVVVHTTIFGSYKQLFGLILIQNAVAQFLIALALTFAVITATDNIYARPEFFGGTNGRNLGHVAVHLIAAFVVPVFAWLIGSAILLATNGGD